MADEPNKIINYNDKYFINSNYIKVFPTANRGAGINLESKVSTEFNFRHLSPNFTKDSYIINADTWNATTSPANTLECCIAGYYFEIALAKSEFKYPKETPTIDLNYLAITLVPEDITKTETTWRLASRLSTSNEDGSSAGASDTILDTEDIFTGLELLESLPSISETSATYYLDITNKNKVVIDYSRIQSEIKDVAITGNLTNGTNSGSIAQIYDKKLGTELELAINTASGENAIALGYNTSAEKENTIALGTNTTASNKNAVALGNNTIASGENAIALGNNTIANKSNIFVIGQYNKDANDNDLFIVGNGHKKTESETEDVRTNILEINKDKIIANKQIIITDSTQCDSYTTGALIIEGGIGSSETIRAKTGIYTGGTLYAGKEILIPDGKFKVNSGGNTTIKGTLDQTGQVDLGTNATDNTGASARSAVKISKSNATTQVLGKLQVDESSELKGITKIGTEAEDSSNTDSAVKISKSNATTQVLGKLQVDESSTFSGNVDCNNGLDVIGNLTCSKLNGVQINNIFENDNTMVKKATEAKKSTTANSIVGVITERSSLTLKIHDSSTGNDTDLIFYWG